MPSDLLKYTEQNVNNQSLIQEMIRSWIDLATGGHGHVICMGDANGL